MTTVTRDARTIVLKHIQYSRLKMKYSIIIDTERVIYEVQNHPLLWDKRHPNYKDRDARAAAWLEICNAIIPNLDSYTEDQQKDIGKKVHQRWRNARDMYTKEKETGKQSLDPKTKKKKRKYEYFNLLTFLDREDTATDDTVSEADDGMRASSPSAAMPSSTVVPVQWPSASAATYQQSIPAPPPKRKKPTPDFENNVQEYTTRNQLELESEDLAFFQSLQPSLKNFTNYQKLMFRTRVMQVIMEMDAQNANCPSCGQVTVVIKQEGNI